MKQEDREMVCRMAASIAGPLLADQKGIAIELVDCDILAEIESKDGRR